MQELKNIKDVKLYPSVANFFLMELQNPEITSEIIVSKLKQHLIFIRNCDSMSQQFRNNCIRVAVKDHAQNERIIKALSEYL